MLVFSRFKAALIIGVCLLGVALSIPSLMPPGVLPAWLPRINLGLDLQGGSYLLLEVDADGGPALNEFALTLMFGLVLATSSSIFIAAPILLNLGEHRLGKGRVASRVAAPDSIPQKA